MLPFFKMPELPEVESIRLQLKKYIVRHAIEDVVINYSKTFDESSKQKVVGSKVAGVRRFGKALVIDLSNNFSLVAHVKMTGQFIYQGPNLKSKPVYTKKVVGGVPGKHTHIIFKLDRGGVLYFNDYRKFGWVKVIVSKNIKEKSEFIGKLGPEFLNGMNQKIFSEILSKSKKPIKLLLMDQQKMAGVGNIYANDALWLAKVKPTKESKKLRNEEVIRLFKAVEKVLKEGIKRGGASELAFVTPDGSEGKYQDFTLVYGREGKQCRNCKTPIKKIKLSGRGTYFCQKCQS